MHSRPMPRNWCRAGIFPSYKPGYGSYSISDFLLAILLCLIGIGFFVLIYMLVVQPAGALVVTYEQRAMD